MDGRADANKKDNQIDNRIDAHIDSQIDSLFGWFCLVVVPMSQWIAEQMAEWTDKFIIK